MGHHSRQAIEKTSKHFVPNTVRLGCLLVVLGTERIHPLPPKNKRGFVTPLKEANRSFRAGKPTVFE